MKILWLCNIMLPVIAKSLGLNASVKEGWLDGIAGRLLSEKNNKDLSLCICFPHKGDSMLTGTLGSFTYYGFPEDTSSPEIYDPGLEGHMQKILEAVRPDIVHCFGTEYPHTLAMARAFNRPERLLIGIQGLMGEYAKVYRAGIPDRVFNRVTLRDFIRRDSLKYQQEKFYKRAEFERQALLLTGHITGRTRWDREHTGLINPKAAYHHMNETLRSPFYTASYERYKAEPHSIFVSQANYPIKGIHYLLEALPPVLEKYPDTIVYAAGDSIIRNKTLKDKLKLSSYGKYVLELIRELKLEKHVIYTGPLDQQAMLSRYLKSRVFISPSEIENSPNSVGEAMLLGMNVISSDGGGVTSMIEDGQEGQVYSVGDIKALTDCIMRAFDPANEGELALMGERAAKRARITHDPDRNYNRLLEIYEEMA